MDENVIKGIAIVLFFLDTLIFGNIAYFLIHKGGAHSKTRDIIISYLNCFSGGVFLGACLLHLLVEGRETLQEYFELAGSDVEFPVYETIVAGGFFLIGFIEQLAHMYLNKSDVHPVQNGGTDRTEVAIPVKPSQSDTTVTKSAMTANSQEEDGDGLFKMMEVRPIRAYLLLGAFSFHTVFDGLAVGLQKEESAIWEMFAAIVIHKSLVALCLGLQLYLVYKSKPIKAFVCILIFSLISPVGIGIGMSVLSSDINEYAKTLSRGILEGISTGTFLYVAFFEILHEELGNKKGLLRLLLVVIGFGGTCLPKIFHEEE